MITPSTVEIGAAFARLAEFLADGRLTPVIAALEQELDGGDGGAAACAAATAGVRSELLTAALLVRRHVGRLNDVIHAAAISMTLPIILEPGERLQKRPSLAAGNDQTRSFDIETDRRVAEFKLAEWSGGDAMRKRTLFHHLVYLAADESGRRAELYVAGPRPLRFLSSSTTTAAWALDRGTAATRHLFVERFGPLSMPVHAFTTGPAARVHLIDLTNILLQLQTAST